jgi:carboxyl-terminal processing protease
MRPFERIAQLGALTGAFGVAAFLAFRLHGGGLWEGLPPASASGISAAVEGHPAPYDLTQLRVVNEVLKTVRDRYVDPHRVRPREMLLSSLNQVQREVAQVIVIHEENSPTVTVRVDTQERQFRVDNVQGPWDVSARLREIFAFLQDGLRGTDVDLREVEYAACNGMLRTLDPHSVLLSPEAYKEMNLTTSGQFGGLGIVISIRDQQLTVMNPMPGTPAGRAGIKRYDRIVKINGESTLNMGLNEAVNHLRGAPGSDVTIWVSRDGGEPHPYKLQREIIHVASVDSHLLDGGVGYVRLKQFQANTSQELDSALDALRRQNGGELKGLVLDLRSNPGGLLEQAAKVVDKFVSEGPIVATVGNPSEGREEKMAHPEGTEANYPMAVLVNASSASASEIVTGALKNHDRAVVVGETSFGKGSVQLVFTDLPDHAALKLTIAQYLTEPGDISIQGVGVTPDVELDPMTVDAQEMNLAGDTSGILKERDLSRSLSNARARDGQRPAEVVRYDLPMGDLNDLRERGGDPDENFQLDFPIRFSRDFVTHVQQGKRPDQIRQAHVFIDGARKTELDKVAAELGAMGADWTDAPADVQALATPTPPPNVEVRFDTDRPNNEVAAGDTMNLRLTITNHGTVPLYRVYGTTKSDDPLFDAKELAIGRLDPNRPRTVTVPVGFCETKGRKIGSTQPFDRNAPRECTIPKDTLMRSDIVHLHFEEARNRAPADVDAQVTVRSLERPIFAYSYHIVDNRQGANGDGRAQRGEGMTMYLTVKNIGKGRSFETQANIRNLSGDGLLLHDGRFDISNMEPGQSQTRAFTFDVTGDLTDNEAKVELAISDRDLRESVVEKVKIPILSPLAISPARAVLRAKAQGADLFQAPDATGRVFGRLPAGTAVQELGTVDGYAKVSLGTPDGRFAFLRISDADPGGAPASPVAFDDTMGHAPPALDLSQVVLSTRDGDAHITGTASDDERLLDTFIVVGSRKVFYQSNRNGTDPRHMGFAADLPLRPGVNYVSVVARQNPDTTTRRTFVVRRDGPNGEGLPTPKTDDDLSESAAADDE